MLVDRMLLAPYNDPIRIRRGTNAGGGVEVR
jgi:hypothetical protein